MSDDGSAPVTHARPASAFVDSLGSVACVYLALITIGFAAFRFLPGALPTGASHNADRTFFSSVNAVTLAGFEQSFASVSDFPAIGKSLLAILSLGGALTTVVGGLYFLRSIVGASIRTRTLVVGAIAIVVAPTIVGATFSGFDGCYAATRLGLLTRPAGGGGELAWLIALGVPAVVGPAVWLARGNAPRPIAVTLGVAAILYVASTFLFAATAGSWLDDGQLPHNLSVGSSLSVNASAGVGINAAWPARSGATPWAVAGLMAIGTVPAGLGAGIGLLPLVVVGRRAVCAARVEAVEASLLAPAIASIAAWIAIAFATLLVLAATQPAAQGDRLLFVVISALSNVGLSYDPIDLTRTGSFVLSLAMLAGRLLPTATLCAMAIAAERERSMTRS